MPVMIAPEVSPEPAPNRRGSLRRRRAEPAAIEQEIGGAPVRISSSAVADATAAVITAQPVSRG